ncbi:ABC transporter permease [Paralimibaculum aggregatum]|uniref:ABC transporter permease n=1 Tax=Paralimibaculum aggregatum TaxID=3036245 RepID=A0ABQ6LNN6_9RHOB|nr:ABC transporter permease subunit [Limibaculum sp. NKW23]GMG83317.1 ABC transporter permease [Limibaculum sp. NKW23]
MGTLLEYAPLLGEGALVTISLAVLALVLATALGVAGCAAKLSRGLAWEWLAAVYTTIVRGVPDLVLILLIYFGGQRLVNQIGGALGAGYIEVSEYWAGVISIGFIYGAYLTETFRGAYQSIPHGQAEAANALGLSAWQRLRLVMAPQVLRLALPGYGNVWMVLVKSTAVVSVIGLHDLVGLADKAGKATREPFLFFLAVIAVYLAITSVSNWGLARLEARVNRGQPGWI